MRANLKGGGSAAEAHRRVAQWLGLLGTMLTLAAPGVVQAAKTKAGAGMDGPISFHNAIRPILQEHCYGCHQPAKAKGDYVMTEFARLMAGSDSAEPPVRPGKPDDSEFFKMIVPVNGEAEMPKGKDPLSSAQIALVKSWIAQGAIDDSPPSATARYDVDHPPQYLRPPVLTSIQYSPDGRLLAVSGFHEVVLVDAQTGQRAGRLIGLSQRIQSLSFSPDGKRLAVTGGLPGVAGEIQIWNVADRKLELSAPITFDTTYGASWSPDGSKIAFGCGDNTVRAIDAKTGTQVLFQGVHTDWILGTVFSRDGKHVISAGRDGTVKLTETVSSRFVDNITSITPGALKGGIAAVAMHPKRDEIVIGGADGVPKVYRVHRQTRRVIGDDSNLIRKLPAMTGRIGSVAVSHDGKRIAAAASLDGRGEIHVYGYQFDTSLTPELKAIMDKTIQSRTQVENATLEAYTNKDVKTIATTSLPTSSAYAVAFHPGGRQLVAAGSDGTIRVIETETGRVQKEIMPFPVETATVATAKKDQVASDFVRDVNPVLAKLGCNQGTCHGSLQGKNGFKLSLRGYDPVEDVRALTDDVSARRINVAAPSSSLMLTKPTGEVPHEGGQLMEPGGQYYQLLLSWIEGGGVLHLDTPRVTSIAISPLNPVVELPGAKTRMRVVATYADGVKRDVTAEAFIESGSNEVATADKSGTLTAVRRGEAPVLARYEGAYAATTLTVMGDRTGFVWQEPPAHNEIDRLAARKWERLKILPSGLADDAEFIRRVTLDLTGLPPSAEETRAFMADRRSLREKRDDLINQLVGNADFVEHWTNKWADLLQVNSKFLGPEGASEFRAWIRKQIAGNTPYDSFVRSIVAASGSTNANPAAAYYKILRQPEALAENTTHLFLAVRFNCNKCHDHPFERWTQNQYYETAAFFSQVDFRADPVSNERTVKGTAVRDTTPLYEIVFDKKDGQVSHPRTKMPLQPTFPFETKFSVKDGASQRERLAAWIVSPDNRYFAKSLVNRMWGYLMGRGIIEPIDDIRAGNPATNPELLDYLTREFINSGFDVRKILRLITKSRTYQLSIETNKWNEDDVTNHSHAIARRLPAEVLYDAVHAVTGSVSRAPGVQPGTRAAAFTDSGTEVPGGFLATFGRPARESSCECERSNELRLGAVMSLVSGPTLADAIADPKNAIAELVRRRPDDTEVVNELFMRILNRPVTPGELVTTKATFAEVASDHERLKKALAERETSAGKARASLEATRRKKLTAAQSALAKRWKEVGDDLSERRRKHAEHVDGLMQARREHGDTLPQLLAVWESKQDLGDGWARMFPSQTNSSNGSNVASRPDFTVRANQSGKAGTYTIVTRTNLKNITGIRLETLTDEDFPNQGPGRGEDGAFVLDRFSVEVAPADNPEKKTPVRLKNALVDFTAPGSDPLRVIAAGTSKPDDAAQTDKPTAPGWSIVGSGGVTHWATFEAAKSFGFDKGSVLTFKLHSDSPLGNPGRFRLSVTTRRGPIGLGLSDDLRALLGSEKDSARKAALMKYLKAIDPEYVKRNQALVTAQANRPTDAQLDALTAQVDELNKETPEDPELIKLRLATEASTDQVAEQRLTVAQDLTWALINSPAFLFNR